MIMSLRGNQRLLHTRQNLFCLRQRQPQIGDLGKAGGSIDLYQVDTICRAVAACFDQSQNPTHARSPGQKDKDRRIAPGPIPPISGQSLQAGGMGMLGAEQLAWLADDVKGLSTSTPIVVFAHIPLWTISKDWGWGTDDSEQALSLLKKFGSVTVLNGHIHQLMQKTEGNVTFYTARSTAFPQPAPGTAPAPTPLVVPADKLRSVLGIRTVDYTQGKELLAITDQPLASS